MKTVAILIVLACGLALLPAAFAQDTLNHGEVGVFADFFHEPTTNQTFMGVGARAGFNVHPNVQLEGEMGYDFEQVFTEVCGSGPCLPPTNRTGLRIINGLFGFKFQKSGNVRPFLVAKGGFINFGFTTAPATWGAFTSQVSNLRSSTVNGVLYPGGGIEFFKGPIGLRLEVGDDIYFLNGAHNNIRATGGPQFRF